MTLSKCLSTFLLYLYQHLSWSKVDFYSILQWFFVCNPERTTLNNIWTNLHIILYSSATVKPVFWKASLYPHPATAGITKRTCFCWEACTQVHNWNTQRRFVHRRASLLPFVLFSLPGVSPFFRYRALLFWVLRRVKMFWGNSQAKHPRVILGKMFSSCRVKLYGQCLPKTGDECPAVLIVSMSLALPFHFLAQKDVFF